MRELRGSIRPALAMSWADMEALPTQLPREAWDSLRALFLSCSRPGFVSEVTCRSFSQPAHFSSSLSVVSSLGPSRSEKDVPTRSLLLIIKRQVRGGGGDHDGDDDDNDDDDDDFDDNDDSYDDDDDDDDDDHDDQIR